MLVEIYGSRGSVPVSSAGQIKYGGNTTCLRIISQCLPANDHLIIDAGSGFVPLSSKIMQQHGPELFAGKVNIRVFFTHYHYDHTQGLLLSPLTFIKPVNMFLYGPVDHSVGPGEMMELTMRPPFFPVSFKEQSSHFSCKSLEFPKNNVIVFHQKGGMKILTVEQFEIMEKGNGQVPVGKSGKFPLDECLVIRMFRSNHPEQTISYRFEERPTGKVFVLLTDHENQPAIPAALRQHLKNVDLLIVDTQYLQAQYEKSTCGYGHGTPEYAVSLAINCGIKKLGLTHHDPMSTDEQVEKILAEGREALCRAKATPAGAYGTLSPEDIFTCADYQIIKI